MAIGPHHTDAVVERNAVADEADAGRVRELHDRLVLATADHDQPPRDLLAAAAGELPADCDTGLRPRERVAIRLLGAGALDAAWAVLQDNAVGVTTENLRTSTLSQGAPRTAWRLPLLTYVEPPRVFAWLPGFRDPRFAAGDDAYDITDLVRPMVRLEELWWDGPMLVLAGTAYLRHLPVEANDEITVLLRHTDRPEVEVAAERARRADFVTGGVDFVTRRAWTGWAVRIDARSLRPSGTWRLSLRLASQGLTHEVRLGRRRGDAVPATSSGRARSRRAGTRFADDQRLDLLLVDAAPMRRTRDVLHRIARSAPGR